MAFIWYSHYLCVLYNRETLLLNQNNNKLIFFFIFTLWTLIELT